MKKALIAALCFVIVGFAMVNGTFAGDFSERIGSVFATIEGWLGDLGKPKAGGEGTAVHVKLVSTDENTSNLLPGGSASRSFSVKNAGTNDVYFRLAYAVQYDEATWERLKIDFNADQDFLTHEGWKEITISGMPYMMKVFTYTQPLSAKQVSPKVEISIAMDSTITSADMARYRSDFLQAQVLAIDATVFTEEKGYKDAKAALDAALPLNNDFNPF